MALVTADRVKETTTVTTGTATLLGAATGFQSFAVIGNSNTTYYCIAGQGTSEWEVGIGTYTTIGTTLARTTIIATSSASQPTALTFSAGTKDVFVTYPSSKGVYLDASGNAIGLGTPAAFVATNVTGLPISTGVSGLGSNVVTALGVAVGSAGAIVVNGGVLGTPSSGTVTNLTGTASININGTVGATTPAAGAFTTLSTTGSITYGGITLTNAVTGTGKMVLDTSPVLTTPNIGTPSAGVISACTSTSMALTTPVLTNPTVTNYVETVQVVGVVGATPSLTQTTGTILTATLTPSTACAFSLGTATAGKSFILILTQAATGMTTATFTSVKWPGGTAPVMTATASAKDIFTFVADGTSWYGTYAQAFA